MYKFTSFFKNASSLLLILISVGLGVLAKFIEYTKAGSFAMGLQLICFVIFIYALIKMFNSIFK